MAKLRLEFFALGAGRGRLGGQVDAKEAEPLGAVTLDVTGTATAGGARPTVPSGAGTVFADISALADPVYVDIGPAPDPTTEPRLVVTRDRSQRLHVTPGHLVSAVLASDLSQTPSPTQDQPIAATVTDRSGTIAAGGVAQQACAANAVRKLLSIHNPSSSQTLHYSETGTAGIEAAGSTQLGPGAKDTFDKVVPAGAISIIGQTTGQPFTVKEA